MNFDPRSRRFDFRRLFPVAETDEDEPFGEPEGPASSGDEESTDDPAGRDVDEALRQIESEECCVCPLCGAIVASDGSIVG